MTLENVKASRAGVTPLNKNIVCVLLCCKHQVNLIE
jgi:hypothetical protein